MSDSIDPIEVVDIDFYLPANQFAVASDQFFVVESQWLIWLC